MERITPDSILIDSKPSSSFQANAILATKRGLERVAEVKKSASWSPGTWTFGRIFYPRSARRTWH